MKKEWFIFKGTHHHGPYTLQELIEFYQTGELNDQSLVWKEGTEKWEAFAKTAELTATLNLKPVSSPPLPAIPDDEGPPALPAFLAGEDDLPPPVPLDALLDPKRERDSLKAEMVTPSPLRARLRVALWVVFVFVFAGLVGWFINEQFVPKTQVKIKGIMPVYLERLQETAQMKSGNLMVSMALSLDGKTIWVTTNKSGTIPATIKLSSLPKRVLGSHEVALTVRGTIRNGVGRFERMQLTKGSQFVPGEYKFDFSGKKIHFINEKFKFLSRFDVFKKLNSAYHFKGETLIYAGTPREFEKKLMDHHEGILNEKLKPYQDKLERLSTFTSLLNQAAENYLRTLEKIKKGQEIAQFESSYQKEISPIIQSLVVAAIDISRNPEFKEEVPNPVAPYKQQIELGKQIGEMASDMITETRKFKKLTQKDKNALKLKFENRYRSIKIQLDINTKKLQDQIQKLSV